MLVHRNRWNNECKYASIYCHSTGGVDYDSGPYAMTFRKGKKVAKVCFDIIDDETWETDEIFGLEIDNASLPAGVVRSSPYKANVTLLDDEGM